MYSLKPLTPPSVSISKPTGSGGDVLQCDPAASQHSAAASAAAAGSTSGGGGGGGGGVMMQAAPPPPLPVVITSPVDCVGFEQLGKDVMRCNLSMVDTADGNIVDDVSGTDDHLHQHGLPSSATKPFSQ